MMIDLKPETIDRLRELLEILDTVAEFHKPCHDDQELIEPYQMDDENYINIPGFTVGVMRLGSRIKKDLKL